MCPRLWQSGLSPSGSSYFSFLNSQSMRARFSPESAGTVSITPVRMASTGPRIKSPIAQPTLRASLEPAATAFKRDDQRGNEVLAAQGRSLSRLGAPHFMGRRTPLSMNS